MINLLIVAAGGALGAAGRYAVGLLPVKSDFPLLTLLVNAAGAVIIGFLAGLFARGGLYILLSLLLCLAGVLAGQALSRLFAK